MKVLIADDHEVIRLWIKNILREKFTLSELAEAFDTSSLIEQGTSRHWDIIISDVSMPGGGGIDALKKILTLNPLQRILILTSHPEDQYAIPVLQAGAYGFLNKDAAHDKLIYVVTEILHGRRFIPPSLVDRSSEDI